jgi:hypothetical protein
MAGAYRDRLAYLRRHLQMTSEEAILQAEALPGEEHLARIKEKPADQLYWHDLEELAKVDPALPGRCWEFVKEAAREDLHTGMRAWRAVRDPFNSNPWDLAQFLAIREGLIAHWQPRGGTEQLLIDTMAQAYSQQHRWLKIANERLTTECHDQERDLKDGDQWQPPRVRQAEAMEQAMAMVERWNRLLLRTLRALRDLRRYTPTITIQNAGQVNIGSQQLNVAE